MELERVVINAREFNVQRSTLRSTSTATGSGNLKDNRGPGPGRKSHGIECD